MVGAVAKVVEAAFSVGEETTGGSAHTITVGAFDDAGCSTEGGAADGVVLRTSPETENHKIGLMNLPPERIADVGGRRPENGRGGIVWRV